MSALADMLVRKALLVMERGFTRDELFVETDDPGWRTRHKRGPVRVRINCVLCGETVASDLRGYGWLENDGLWSSVMVEHLKKHA